MTHGLTLTQSSTSAVIAAVASLSVIGLIATSSVTAPESSASLDAAFPLNTAVLVTDVNAAAGLAGSGGTLKNALLAIADVVTPVIVVVRVAEGEDADATNANVIGATDGNTYTGLQALLTAEASLGQRPRILGAPGLDTQEVANALAIAAKKLRGRVFAKAIGDDIAAAVTYRGEFGAKELSLIWPDFNTWSGDAVARAMGLRAQINASTGYHKTISNVVVDGVTSITKDVHYDLLDPTTDAGVLNDADIITLIRDNGYRFWGNRTCAGEDDAAYSFESAVMTNYALQDIITETIKADIDKPMTVPMVKNYLEKVSTAFAAEVTAGRVVGAEATLPADSNTSTELAAGRPHFKMRFTPCAPMENPNVDLEITDDYYSDFADQIA
ncbi:phage tail sheath subtilisin-like domain-containing protein [Novosphingobium sp. 9]|uniref:phage tail sheath subtilisin-like domain-containing protein n=1 Tax=Novosphingobium sp. 9 TaxID=2025349 RepID=UPI0021B6B1B8|nr:phage tail sheath subtilisin-like domain-containing protein [Novosphingobium sp. 9]